MKTLRILFFLLFILSLLSIGGNAQVADTAREFINFRRTDPTYLPAPEKYSQPKEEVFPLGWNKGTLGKVTSGTGIWTELNPLVPRTNYIGLHFVNNDTGWACGGSGAIIKTTNAGSDWTISETPVTNLLLKIHSFNGQVVICTGYDGIILRSSDGGENFAQVVSGVGSGIDLWGVDMVNDTLGWISGTNATLLKTTDAGQSWQQVTPGLNDHYWSLDFLSENYGMIACGGGKILKTTDGGINWTQTQAGDTRALFTIDIIDSLYIAAAGVFGKNVYSSDGGNSWVTNADIPAFSATNWIDFVDKDTGYSVQDVTNIKKTTNRGQTWFNPTINNLENICEWHIQLLEDGTGYACGEEIGGFYALNFYKRTNWLDNWSRIFLNVNWNDVFFINEMKGFLISSDVLNGGLYKTQDGGATYQRIENAPNGNDLFFLDSLTGFIAGTHKSTDGGETWYTVNGGETKVFFINNNIGWSIGGRNIYKTTDGGENWAVQLVLPADNFSSIFFIDTLNGWVTSRYIWQTTDGGANWIQRTDIPIIFSDDVYFRDSLNGWIISGNQLYYTTNGGFSWVLDPQIYTYSWHFETITDSHYIITGGNIYESRDAGQIWENITGEVGSGFTSLQAPVNYLAYGVGTLGYIVSYVDTSIVPVELTNFSGEYSDNKVRLQWITVTETNNYGFEILRSDNIDTWEKIGFILGHGTTTEKNEYSFVDSKIYGNKIYYKLKLIDFNGSFNYSEIINVEIPANNFFLSQNYPNPTNPVTNILFILPQKSFVKINLFSVNGELIKQIINEEKEKGVYNIKIDVSNLASGVYLYRMTTDKGFSDVKKMILLK